jgi:RHS repeat-associated protein
VNPVTTGLSLTGASPYADPYLQYGLTAYTFGLELDRPVSVIRANWVGAYTPSGAKTTPVVTSSPMAFYPHYLDGGQPYSAAFADGRAYHCDGGGVTLRCLTPAVNFRADFLPWAQGSYVESAWLGSLLSDKQNKTLTFYRRNRVYDPLTRQFTQEDPIGLAGGLNLYGFANGDPVNFTDPFGLYPCCVVIGLPHSGLYIAVQQAGDQVALDFMIDVASGGIAGTERGLAKGIVKTIERAQGAKVAFSQLGKFTRAMWKVAGDKGAGYVKWNRVLNEEGSTVRLFKDVYDQGGKFLRRDWYVGGPPK